MTQEQNNKLKKALDDVYQCKEMRDLVDLVIELSESEECTGGYMNIYPDVERCIDDLAVRAGWIYDSLNKKTKKRGMSVTQKIRKVLGYTYP